MGRSIEERLIKLEIQIRGPEVAPPVKVLVDPSDAELSALEAESPDTLFIACRTINCRLEVTP